MRVCQILAGDEEGGLEKHFEELCNRLVSYHEVHVIAHEKYRERFDEKIVFHSLDLSKGRKNIFILFCLFRLIKIIEPQILHAHANKAVDMIATIKPFLSGKIKLVASLHSQKRKLSSFEKFDHVIGVSHTVLQGLKNRHKSVVYNGVALQDIKKDPSYLDQFGIYDGFVICAVGRLESIKNFSLLIRAVKELDVKLLIAGEGSEKDKLQKLVNELNIEEKVRFAGFRRDVPEIIINSDICVISSDREGFSYVMAEALLLGVPVLSTEVGDMKKILPTSFVVPVNDLESLRSKIYFLQEHYMEVLAQYEKSFQFAKKHFTLDAMVESVLHIYSKIVKV